MSGKQGNPNCDHDWKPVQFGTEVLDCVIECVKCDRVEHVSLDGFTEALKNVSRSIVSMSNAFVRLGLAFKDFAAACEEADFSDTVGESDGE